MLLSVVIVHVVVFTPCVELLLSDWLFPIGPLIWLAKGSNMHPTVNSAAPNLKVFLYPNSLAISGYSNTYMIIITKHGL